MDRVINTRSRETRKTISTSSPVSDMFRKLSSNVKSTSLSNEEKTKLINSERTITSVPPPQWFPLTRVQLFKSGDVPDWRLLRKFLAEEGRLTSECAIELLAQAASLFREQPNMLELTELLPLTVVGDIHGQFYDLMNLLDTAGDPEKTPYLFLGDYVDRGMFSTEVVLLLAAIKCNYPSTFHMLRGNHECRLLTSHFNFMEECLVKYDAEVYYMFMELFDMLPVAATVTNSQGKYLLVHGGISPDIVDLEQINTEVDRFVEPAGEGILCDILWSDPIEEATADGLTMMEMMEWDSVDYVPNPDRGCSYVFGYAAIKEFCESLGLVTVIRAHEVQKAGFREHRFLKDREHPYLITVFSAPNYCLTTEHQILTNRGFLHMRELDEAFEAHDDMLVATYDERTQHLVYQRPSRVVVNAPRTEQVLEFARGDASVVVTENHNMYVRKGRFDASGHFSAARAPARQPDGSQLLEESAYSKARADQLRGEDAADGISMLLAAPNGAREGVRPAPGQGMGETEWAHHLRAHGRAVAENKAIFAPWVWQLGARDMRTLLEGLDEEARGAVRASSVEFRDQVVRACLHAGYSARADAALGEVCYTRQETEVQLRCSSDVVAQSYTGHTWCVTVPNGLIVARRGPEGRPLIVGNCDVYNNKAAFMRITQDDEGGMGPPGIQFVQTASVEHPFMLPGFMDGLSYSLPFVMENLSRLAEDLMTICLPDEEEEVAAGEEEEVERLRAKILAVSRMRHVMAEERKDRRRSIKMTRDEPSTSNVKKFEAALEMDFMDEYRMPGRAQGPATLAPIYRGRSRSLNFIDSKKSGSGPPLPKFLQKKEAPTEAPTGLIITKNPRIRRDTLSAQQMQKPAPVTQEAPAPGTYKPSPKQSRRKSRGKAIKLDKPPVLQDNDDWGVQE